MHHIGASLILSVSQSFKDSTSLLLKPTLTIQACTHHMPTLLITIDSTAEKLTPHTLFHLVHIKPGNKPSTLPNFQAQV